MIEKKNIMKRVKGKGKIFGKKRRTQKILRKKHASNVTRNDISKEIGIDKN